jgi:hypothetical protein
MAGLDPAIHVIRLAIRRPIVDGRVKPGRDMKKT